MSPEQLEVVASLPCSAYDPPRIGPVAAYVGDLDAGPLKVLDQGGVVIDPWRIASIERLAHATLVQPMPGLVGEADAVGAAVIQDGDPATWPPLGQQVAGDLALAVIAADQPEDVAPALFGQPQVAGSGGQHRHPGYLVDRGRHQRGMRAKMADHEADAGIDQRVRGRLGLLNAAGIIRGNQLNGLAKQPAVTVQLLHRDFNRSPITSSGRSKCSGKRAGEADPDLRHTKVTGTKKGCDGKHETEMPRHGVRLPSAGHLRPARKSASNITCRGSWLQAVM